MRWIKYEYICGTNSNGDNILVKKKVGYSEANLVIAQNEAYNGEYTIEEDDREHPNKMTLPSDVDMSGNRILNIGDAENDSDVASVGYVKSKIRENPGPQGPAGVSPSVSLNKSGKVTTITVTDANGTKTATINDGADGAAGAAGKTPVKGTDYWTASDREEMISDVIAALPDASEVSY